MIEANCQLMKIRPISNFNLKCLKKCFPSTPLPLGIMLLLCLVSCFRTSRPSWTPYAPDDLVQLVLDGRALADRLEALRLGNL